LLKRLLLGAALVLLTAACGGPLLRAPEPKGAALPLVSFVFDDGNDTDCLVAMPIFAAHGAVASTAVTTDRIGTPEYLTVAQIRELDRAGWEIMSHTVSHPRLPALPPAGIEAELARSKAGLEALGVPVANLVYPFNRNDAVVREIAGRHYRAARGGGSDFNRGVPDRTLLKSFSFKHDVEAMERRIDQAHAEKSWLIFYLHEINAKVKLTDTVGEFQRGETLRLTPSGAVARFTVSQWFPLYGSLLYLVPLSGQPQAGDVITGANSGATAKIDYFMYDEPAQLDRMLGYIRNRYPTMRIVTVNQALDLLGVPKPGEAVR
jgi:peptidoglycan/xylan/chitin deacetylase (PgdA/CDA1 family)